MIRTFVESSGFSKRVNQEGVELLREIQAEVLQSLELGDIIPGTAGLRKLRVGDVGRKKGKRGGFRVIYLDLPHVAKTYLLALYDKSEKSDISAGEKKVLRGLVDKLKKETTR